MPITQERSKRKASGGRYKSVLFKKRLAQKGNAPTHTKLGEQKVRVHKARGNSQKSSLSFADKVIIFDPKTKKSAVEKIKSIVENPANPQFVRRNIITKGAIVDTAKGKVKITSRPGQQGSLSGVLV